jgi:TPR repeat protein
LTDIFGEQYYETAANLGDTGKLPVHEFPPDCVTRFETDNMADAMNEVAWCYTEGFGCKKDKVRYYRPGKNRTFRIASWCHSH